MTKIVKILILEDCKDSLRAIAAMVEKVSSQVSAVPVGSLEEARCALQNAQQPFQAFLLDINLNAADNNDISGITFAGEIRSQRQYVFTPIVMITSIANMELKAYRELHCYQYLIKPYQEDDIAKLIGKLLFLSQSGETREPFILVKNSGVNYKLFCKDILCIKAIPRGVNVVMRKEELRVPYMTIKQILEKLPQEKFVQVHRMCVVNKDYIDYIDMVNSLIKLKNGELVEIGTTYKNGLRKLCER